MNRSLQVIPVRGIPKVGFGDEIARIIIPFLDRARFEKGDIVVVTHSIVSIAEESVYAIGDLTPSDEAVRIAELNKRNPVLIEAALREASDILHKSPVLITKTRHGIITDYSGIDGSNAPEGYLVALPRHPDESAQVISKSISDYFGFPVPVIISDTQGRPWRKGAVNIAIGLSGISPLIEYTGLEDIYGRQLKGSSVCLADEIASMAELVMGQSDEGIPVAIVRGVQAPEKNGSAREILRGEDESIF